MKNLKTTSKKSSAKAKSQKISTSKLKKKADELFSRYIRLKNSKNGKTTCYTCKAVADWKEHQCGHFVSRVHLSTRWDEDNARVQCFACNIWRKGNYDEFSRNLVKEMGPSILDELNARKNAIKSMKRYDYELLIDDLKEKIANLDK